MSVTNTTIANGLYINSTGISPTVTGNTITNVDNSPVHAGANIIAGILSNNTINGMTSAGKIEVVGEQINQDTRWLKWNAPYVVTTGTVSVYKDSTTPSTLTIDPGVTIKFASSSGLTVGSSTSQGALIAQGTAGDRITLTRSGAGGTWTGMTFNDKTVDATTILENVDIQYAATGMDMNIASPTIKNSTITNVTGYGQNLSSSSPVLENMTISNSGTYGIYLASSSPVITGGSLTNTSATGQGIYGSGSPVISNYNVSIVNTAGKYGLYLSTTTSAMSVTNTTIANGLYINSTGISPTVTGNTITNVDNSPVHAGANIIAGILSNNTINGMTSAGKIEVVGEQINQDTRWLKWNAPYVVTTGTVSVYKDSTTPSTLTIDPGVTVKFSTGTSLQIGNGSNRGILVAQGTAVDNITFTSSQATPVPGNWNGVTLNGAASGAGIIENVIIEYAGSGANYNNANLTLTSSSPVIRNCIIRNSAGSGIYLSSANSGPVITDSRITSNKWGIYSASSNPTISNSVITGNTTAGISNTSTTISVDARSNWWGAATGPTHSSNPLGTGNVISNNVQFNPWLAQEQTTTFRISEARALPPSLNPEGDDITFTAKMTAAADWSLTITDASSATVRNFNGSGTGIIQKWYGDDSQEVKVADGTYYYKIEAVKSGTSDTAAPYNGLLAVSRNLPVAVLQPPADNQMFTGGTVINITGTASDTVDFNNYTLDYGTGENPSSWTTLKNAITTPITNGLIHSWDTTSLTGGVYTVRLTVNDNGGNSSVETSRVRLLWTQNVSASEGYISPNADAVKDTTTISATFTHEGSWTTGVKNISGTTVRSFSGTGASVAQVWDGKDSSGVVVPDGTYTYQIDAVSPETGIAASPKTGTVVIDSTGPIAQITSPIANAVLRNAATITGTATDTNIDSYQLEFGPSSGSGPWTLLAEATTSVSGGTLGTWAINDETGSVPLSNGNYLIRLMATDKGGNSSSASVPVTLDNLVLFGIGITSHTLDTLSSQTTSVSFAVSAPSTVTMKIVPEKDGPSGAPVYQASQNYASAGSYSLTWDGKNNSGMVVPDEAYLYILEASDGTRTDSYNPAQPTGTGSVSCTQESTFSPEKNDPLTITYTLAQAARLNINISWGSQNFKIMDGFAEVAGIHTYDWDGRNPSGKLLDFGAVSSCSIASLLRENHIITSGDTPKITALKTDPYIMTLAYGQFTRIKYSISRNSTATVKLTSPSGTVITLVDSESQMVGPQEIVWSGMDPADSTGKKTLVGEEGDYMVTIQAVNPVTGTGSTVRGSLRIGY